MPGLEGGAVDASATRLAAAIETGVLLCPEGMAKRVVLVTDGNETVGDARRAAHFARDTGAELHAVVSGVIAERKLVLEKFIAPPLVREGAVFPLRAVVRSLEPAAAEAVLDVQVNGLPATRHTVRLEPGLNVFEIPWQLHERGSYRMAAAVDSERSGRVERRERTLVVAGPIRVLVVSANRDPVVARALSQKRIEVDLRQPGSFPGLDDLLGYHCVVLDDVPRNALGGGALEAIETYVRRFGGGLVMSGGITSFGDKGFQRTALERVLPVSLVEQQKKPRGRTPMGVFLVIDRSNSMGYNSRRRDVRDGEMMAYAKRAAGTLVEQFRDEDRVGVIAFDSDPYVLGPLRKLAEHRAVLLDRIARLQPGGGTDFKAALEIAAAQLAGSGLRALHVVLLTDGDSNRGAADHYELIRRMAALGISVSTIRIGTDDAGFELLRRIARRPGDNSTIWRTSKNCPNWSCLMPSARAAKRSRRKQRKRPPRGAVSSSRASKKLRRRSAVSKAESSRRSGSRSTRASRLAQIRCSSSAGPNARRRFSRLGRPGSAEAPRYSSTPRRWKLPPG